MAKALKIINPAVFGTPDELVAIGLSPAQYGTCAVEHGVKGQADYVLGCPFADICKHPRRFKPANEERKEYGGRLFVGVQIVKPDVMVAGGKSTLLQTTLDCQGMAFLQTQIEANGGMVRVVAEEGETIKINASEPYDETTPGPDGRMVSVRKYRKKAIEMVIPHFPRPKDNPELSDQAFANLVLGEEADKKRAQRVEDAKASVTGGKSRGPSAQQG